MSNAHDSAGRLTVDPEAALREWMRRQPGGAAAAAVLGASPAFRSFVAAAPGVKELVTVGKLADLGPPAYDTVIVDAPSTGHAIGMLTVPRSVGEIARAGVIRRDARELFSLLRDRARTAYVGVTLPEEMPVAEVLDLERRLRDDVGVALALIVVNAVQPDRFTDEEASTIRAVRSRLALPPPRSPPAAGATLDRKAHPLRNLLLLSYANPRCPARPALAWPNSAALNIKKASATNGARSM